ncbi:MAG: TIGR04283 family arsenosugar biosynthesis glycosyltransferase [Cyanobacteria bacterium P01_H01_bin.15]
MASVIKQTPQISIVIPVLNEAAGIQTTLASIGMGAPWEILLVDGGSQDRTCAIAMAYAQEYQLNLRRVDSAPGRGRQMNVGAEQATGEMMLFLHGDTTLPPDFGAQILALLQLPRIVGGAFQLSIRAEGWQYRVLECSVNWRSQIFGLPYGDQGIFMRRSIFRELGGFQEWPLLEDYELVRRLRAHGKLAIANSAVSTSGRRWQELGLLRTTWINQKILLGHQLGIPLDTLARWYRNPANL